MAAGRTLLLLHADDFGFNRAITEGIVTCFSHGLLTGTSILANSSDFTRAMSSWRALNHQHAAGLLPSRSIRAELGDDGLPFDFGVHLNLTQGRPLTGELYPSRLLDRQGRFPGIGSLLLRLRYATSDELRRLRAELAAQIERVLSNECDVTHLNGHQYIELIPSVSEIIFELAVEYNIRSVRRPIEPSLWQSLRVSTASPTSYLGAALKHYLGRRFARAFAKGGVVSPAAFFGSAHAGRINAVVLSNFLQILTREALPSAEIAFHPGELPTTCDDAADGWSDPLWRLRPQEQILLTSSWLRDLLLERMVRLARLTCISGAGHSLASNVAPLR
jgi:predicted glycoside hydrolase/deacetylase ChbG (UPF0249 family)